VKPEDIKTKAQAVAAAKAIFEARLVADTAAKRHHKHGPDALWLDDPLWLLEQSYWNRAESLGIKKRKPAKKRRTKR
jgi:hypothetical protein